MLALPKGVKRSVHKHNTDFSLCCDWIESSVLFLQEEVTAANIVDLLIEGHIYDSQEFAWAFLNDIASHLRDRARLMGHGYPLNFQGQHRFVPKGPATDFTPYAFCLLLSLPGAFPAWFKAFGQDFNEQGELFERLTAESVSASLKGWEVHSTGWSRTQTNKLKEVVSNVAGLLGEGTGDINRWTKQSANEAGLDLLCFHSFPDQRVGVPVYLLQCASGANWEEKLKTPDLRIWKKIVTFAASPKKAFSMPYALLEPDYIRHTNVVNGLLLDRHRLLAPGIANAQWVSGGLQQQLAAWIQNRSPTLPVLDLAAA